MIRRCFRTLISYVKAPPVVHAAHEMNELQEEIEFHLESRMKDNADAGMNADESRRAAQQRFGDVGTVVRDCCRGSLSPFVFWHRTHLAVTLLLAIAVGFLLYHSRPQPAQVANLPAAAESTDASAVASGDIAGTVVDSRDRPVAAAHILAVVKTWPPNGYRQQAYMARTGSDGTFKIENVYPTENEYQIQVAVLAEGHPLQSEYVTKTEGPLAALQFQLQESTPFSVKFESDDGRPLQGVSAFPFQRTDHHGQRHCVYFCSADPIIRESDADGSVAMTNYLPGEIASIYVRFPDRDWEVRTLAVPSQGENVVVLKSNQPPNRSPGRRQDIN